MKKVIAFLLAFIFIFGSFSVISYADDEVDISQMTYSEKLRYAPVWIKHCTGLETNGKVIIDENDLRDVIFLYVEQVTPKEVYSIIDKNSERYKIALAIFKESYKEYKYTLDSDNVPGPYKFGAMAYQDVGNSMFLIIDNNKNIKVFTPSEYRSAIGLDKVNENGLFDLKKSQAVDNATQYVTYKAHDKYLAPPDDAFYLSMIHWGDNNDYLDNYYFSGQEDWPAKYGGGQTPNIPENPNDPTTPGNSDDPDPQTEQENNFFTTLAGIWNSIISFFQMIIQFFVGVFNTVAGFFG